MGRKKIRHYDSVDVVRNKINNYFYLNRDDVINYLLQEVDCSSYDMLRYEEMNSAFGLDCGWVWVYTNNDEQYHEWVLDNGKWDAKVTRIRCPFDCQSTTLKKIQVDKALADLGLDKQYYSSVTLD